VSRNYLLGDYPYPFDFIRGYELLGIDDPIPYFEWLRSEKPVARIGASISVYWITQTDIVR